MTGAVARPGATRSRAASLLYVIAGLMGAAGVALWAGASHGEVNAALLTLAAQFLLMHAIALVAMAGARQLGNIGAIAGWILAAGTLLFAGDLVHRAFLSARLFPFAAPAGGSLMIAGWLCLGLAGVLALRSGRPD
jgi:uncharacterized membrane protein YgdD (TMEM256/DUF423 family)